MELSVNGKIYRVKCHPNTSLLSFIRDHVKLKGTKYTCGEGGCGACVVAVSKTHPITGKQITEAINSCLCPVFTVYGCEITTVEGLGNHRDGFHPIQKHIAECNGSQCGFCTPGMVMSIYGKVCQDSKITGKEMEKSLEGNLCRCTGYRPILKCAKSLIPGGSGEPSVLDIEDIGIYKCKEFVLRDSITYDNEEWFYPVNLETFHQIVASLKHKNIKFIFGSTSSAFDKNNSKIDAHIYLGHIRELYDFQITNNTIIFGANWTLQNMVKHCQSPISNPKLSDGFGYVYQILAPYLESIAGLPIRNASTWAGNIMMKYLDASFPSDIFPALVALQAKVEIAHMGENAKYSMEDFLNLDMCNRLVTSLILPPVDPTNARFMLFKIKNNSGQSKALINSAFFLEFESEKNRSIKNIRIAFGGLSASMWRAKETEYFLKNKSFSKAVFKDACNIFEKEVKVDESQLLPSKTYRITTVLNLLYLFLKNACDPSCTWQEFYLKLSSGRPTITTKYIFEEKTKKYPYCQPMPKLDSVLQASGEAEFTTDLPSSDNELHAVCILAEQAKAKFNIDFSAALEFEGVHSVVTKENMRGNNCISTRFTMKPMDILADTCTLYAGQPLAMVLADDLKTAIRASKAVHVAYSDVQTPIVDLHEAIEKSYTHTKLENIKYDLLRGDAEAEMNKGNRIIEGHVKTESQYHFYMENNMCIVTPYDDMLEIQCTSQVLDGVLVAAANITDKSQASINVKVLRLGGGFGGKGALSELSAPALTVIAAHTSNRAVRLHTSLEHCMKMNGKRFAMLAKYKVAVNFDNKIEAVEIDLYQDMGCTGTNVSHGLLERGLKSIDNAYAIPCWKVNGYPMKTDKPHVYAMRAPDTLPVCFIMESLMEYVAKEIDVDPILFKEKHLIQSGDYCLRGGTYVDCVMEKVWTELKELADIPKRLEDIQSFNKNNSFIKRGLTMTPTRFPVTYSAYCSYNVYLAVYARDGTVAITHGCVEMGQGLNTKVIQVASQCLGIGVEYFKVHKTSTLTSANNAGTFASQGSDNICRSTLEACKMLKDKMNKFQNAGESLPWLDLVKKCDMSGLDMSVSYRHCKGDNHRDGFAYCIYSACAIEVQVNCLTGENTILQLDGIFDVGESINPTVDIGQIEGSLMMGLGYFLSEKEIYDKKTGSLLTGSTWDYKPPCALDIPIKMNLKLLDNNYNDYGVMPAKATGEPPILSSCAVVFALKQAIEAYRRSKNKTFNVIINQPATVEVIQRLCDVNVSDLTDEF